MRSGVVISAIFHVVLVAVVLLSTPRQFDAATSPAVEVELVSADEFEQAKEEPKPEQPKPEKPNLWDIPPEKPLIQLPDFSRNRYESPTSPPSKSPAASKQAAAPQQAPANSQQAPANSQQAALTPPSPTQSPIAAEKPSGPPPPPSSPQSPPSVFDAASIPMLMDLPNAQVYGFDSEALLRADLSGEERAAFKAHLRKCWKLPEGVSPAQSTRIVLRVYLRRDGALASDPVLIEASASRDGPAVLLAAKRALKECQPFGFLPADKYGEWKVLDLSFTPRDMAGG